MSDEEAEFIVSGRKSLFGENQKSLEVAKLEDINTSVSDWPDIRDPHWFVKVARLVELGTDINIKDEEGKTLLNKVTVHGEVGITEKIQTLIDLKANINTRDVRGNTLLHRSAYLSHSKNLQLLLNAGANVNILNYVGESPLHEAARFGTAETVQILLDAGAKTNCPSNDKCKLLDFAKRNNNLIGTAAYKAIENVVLIENGETKIPKQKGENISETYPDGPVYIGELKNKKWHGQGTLNWVHGNKYVGEFKDGVRSGQGSFTFKNGDEYVGEFSNSLFNGHGELVHFNGVQHKYVGDFKDNKKSGHGELRWGGIRYVGQFHDDKQNGHGKESNLNGGEYVGEWKVGKRHGQGTLTKANDRELIGRWEDGNFTGNDTSSKSIKQINNETITADQGTPSSKDPDTKLVENLSKFE